MARIKIDANKLKAELKKRLPPAADKAALGLVGHLRVKVGISARKGTPETERARRQEAKAKRRRAARFLWEPSKPGEPPRKRTGTLQKSVAHAIRVEPDAVVARVGTAVRYGYYLEFGTRKMAARPWLRPGFKEYAPTFGKVLATALKRSR